MAGFFKKLFGGGNEVGNVNSADAGPDEIYKSVEIRANPMKEAGGQWRVAGSLSKEVDGEVVTRKFVRADLVQNKDEAVVTCVNKAKMIIDQNGERLWQGDPDQPV